MDRQSGSHLPIPVTPKESPSQEPLLPSHKQKRRSREKRTSFGLFPRQKTSPIWRPSTGHSPPTPQWPLPRLPIRIHEENPALTKTYTQPRNAPLPPPPSANSNRSSTSSTETLANDPNRSQRPREQPTSSSPSPTNPHHPRSPRSPSSPPRPAYFPATHQRGGSGFQTRYLNMLLNLDKIPRAHNIFANLFAWLVLIAFVVAPCNFTGFPADRSLMVSDNDDLSSIPLTTTATLKKIPSIPLLAICCAAFFLGVLGMLWLAVYWRRNYIWLMNRIYLPLILNSLAGFIATIVVVHVQHGWHWSVAALVTVSVEGASLAVGLSLFALYQYWLLAKLRREHYRETSRKRTVDLVKAGKAPPFAPGSVV
ncbi:hypothetical protein F5883DRAFT_91512 [Diaporthe sp. PMI_573]|nr:hypothetical protein F5883DRAFT_91512 [Diaporthaceae sp. PMI_573]